MPCKTAPSLGCSPCSGWGSSERQRLAPLMAVPMQLLAEIRWDTLGETLIGLAERAPLDPIGLRIDGSLGVDLGYGLMEVPIPLGN